MLSIEDDSSLHKCLYYPKDLVAWAKENSECFTDGGLNARTATPQRPHQFPCPETGSWFTTAQSGSRRYLKQDIVIPAFDSDYSDTFWQRSPDQSASTCRTIDLFVSGSTATDAPVATRRVRR
ncbi:hypothetical protein AB6Q56_06575 [Dechloromonas sp. ARDL1]|uniref:hypothetical protein n=1 Tax=Dechloromonas sp. ARDL1 TaxID=3322121 RepID=UPI003DA6F106